MTPQERIKDLLRWIKSLGLTPEHPRRTDRFLNPYSNRIERYSAKRPKQLNHLLWLPNQEGLRPHLPDVRVEREEGFTTARAGRWEGAGTGESEALLSLFNVLRRELAALGA